MIKKVDRQITQISQIRFWFLTGLARFFCGYLSFWSNHAFLPRSRNGRRNRKSRSIRSSGTPLVSGTKREQSQRPTNERAAYSKNVQTSPRPFSRLRKVSDTTKLLSQLAIVAILAAWPRMFSGKISEISSQNTGPSPIAKEAI